MLFVQVLSLNFLLNASYGDLVENRDQWSQKEADGEYPLLQRRETRQRWTFWPLMTRAQMRILVLNWKDEQQIKKKIWGRIKISREHQPSAFLGREGKLPEQVGEEGTSAFQDKKYMKSSSFLGFVVQSWVAGDGSGNPGASAQDVGDFVVWGCVVILLPSSHPPRTDGTLSFVFQS